MGYDPKKHGALCHKCPRKGQTPVPPEGKPELARCVWLAQDPGKQEEKQGRPLVGATGGRLLSLWTAGFEELGLKPWERSAIWITNASLCMPVTKSEREAKQAALCCRPRLMRELAKLTKGIGILIMGKWALFTLSGDVKGMGKLSGYHVKIRHPTGEDDPLDLLRTKGE